MPLSLSRGDRSLIAACVVFALATGISSLTSTSACAAKPPPNLSPPAVHAWYGTQIIQALDVFRDAAISAQAQQPPLLSEGTTRRIVQYHETTLTLIHAAADGSWAPRVSASLTDLMRTLPASDRERLMPYTALILNLMKEVQP
jgi:hypothetical protein